MEALLRLLAIDNAIQQRDMAYPFQRKAERLLSHDD